MHVVTIGVFDGVHLGHKELLRRVEELAEDRKYRSRVIVVSHPFEHLSGDFEGLITSHERRILLLSNYVDEVIMLDLKSIKDMSAEDFFERFIAKDTAILVVGKDFRFGKNAEGDLRLLENLCSRRNIELVALPDILDGQNLRISSSRIRKLIREGKIKEAEELLGHDYLLEAVVLSVENFDSQDVAVLEPFKDLVAPAYGRFQVEEKRFGLRGTVVFEREVKLFSKELKLAIGSCICLKLVEGVA
ncbi:FAD synthetase family protein [Pseudothermotoga sp.]|uniref:FAD synthetase family protein n=1 Tax=Pseudothermotoga sp. TaxID=2033661 RepID=UPI0031F6F2CD